MQLLASSKRCPEIRFVSDIVFVVIVQVQLSFTNWIIVCPQVFGIHSCIAVGNCCIRVEGWQW